MVSSNRTHESIELALQKLIKEHEEFRNKWQPFSARHISNLQLMYQRRNEIDDLVSSLGALQKKIHAIVDSIQPNASYDPDRHNQLTHVTKEYADLDKKWKTAIQPLFIALTEKVAADIKELESFLEMMKKYPSEAEKTKEYIKEITLDINKINNEINDATKQRITGGLNACYNTLAPAVVNSAAAKKRAGANLSQSTATTFSSQPAQQPTASSTQTKSQPTNIKK